MLFSMLKKDGEDALKEAFTKAVVTIPANSKGLARNATKMCAGAAGMQVLTTGIDRTGLETWEPT